MTDARPGTQVRPAPSENPSVKNPSLRERCLVVLLGSGPHQRARTSLTLLALGAYLGFAVMQQLEVTLGLVDRIESNQLTVFNLAMALGFYALIRSGASQRLAKDPSLTMPQSLTAVVSISWSYGITGPARGAVVAIMILVILFSMFSLPPRQARVLTATGFGCLAAVMAWRSLGPDARYVYTVELMHFIFAAIVMAATAVLAIRLGRLRSRLSAQKAELIEALELNRQLATRDMLTGLLNRRAMAELLAQELPRQRRAGTPMTLALLDIDLFKRINDQHGHHAGDVVLRRFAELARGELRAGDALARWGGEEFLLLMPGAARTEAAAALARLRQRIVHADFGSIAPGLQLSFSAGVSVCGDLETTEQALERADQALYRAKHAGRDRVEFA